MIIAGCLNQAKRILEKYDEVLYGASPEVLVESTHTAIRQLLRSEQGLDFMNNQTQGDAPASVGDEFIKKIVEALAPIVPTTLRNKSLDGTYLRMALHMLGATELLFAQYQQDVREHSNPAGVVGLASAMHSEFESTAIYSNALRPLGEFMTDMKSQYQTSMGLGTPFAKDAFPGSRRRRGRGRAYWRNRGFYQQGTTRAQSAQQGYGAEGSQVAGTQGVCTGTGRGAGIPIQRRGVCFGYNDGTCHRGASCRFLHVNQ